MGIAQTGASGLLALVLTFGAVDSALCQTRTQSQHVGEPYTTQPGGSPGRGGQSGFGSGPGRVQCQLEDDGTCNCNPRVGTGRNRPCIAQQASPATQTITKQFRFTVKSYIAHIGDRLGPTPRNPGDVVEATVNFHLAAVQTDLGFSEDPLNEDEDKQYRLYTHVGLIATCSGGRMVNNDVGTVQSDVGTEPAHPLAGVVALYPAPMKIQQRPAQLLAGSQGVTFGWFGRARPAEVIEPFFTAVSPRTSIYIWHDLTVTVVCGPQGPQVDYARTKLIGSQFPSHRLWINLALVRTIMQGNFDDLWIADPTRPWLVR